MALANAHKDDDFLQSSSGSQGRKENDKKNSTNSQVSKGYPGTGLQTLVTFEDFSVTGHLHIFDLEFWDKHAFLNFVLMIFSWKVTVLKLTVLFKN